MVFGTSFLKETRNGLEKIANIADSNIWDKEMI